MKVMQTALPMCADATHSGTSLTGLASARTVELEFGTARQSDSNLSLILPSPISGLEWQRAG